MTLTHRTLPGIDQACFHTADMTRTLTMCAVDPNPEREYVLRSRPSCASSERVRGQANVIGKVDTQKNTSALVIGKRMMTNNSEACT